MDERKETMTNINIDIKRETEACFLKIYKVQEDMNRIITELTEILKKAGKEITREEKSYKDKLKWIHSHMPVTTSKYEVDYRLRKNDLKKMEEILWGQKKIEKQDMRIEANKDELMGAIMQISFQKKHLLDVVKTAKKKLEDKIEKVEKLKDEKKDILNEIVKISNLPEKFS
ncbi:hypothetical protein [Dipodfec virus UA23Rod_1071]|uniref:Uncharacterized protein n=1 Tax=Dipodfec virus UA23Rod_1071 TaxID=2929326 RepID=A0A976N2C4_9VIRU|nr:hypothetical protein [Dipodfec virus UA23Rod_1071]